MAAQRADGGWSADAQNLRPRYDTGVTALVLLALMHADPAALEGPQAPAIRAGMDHLLRQQGPDGRFGGDFSGTGFTHYLASMAVQAAAQPARSRPGLAVAAALGPRPICRRNRNGQTQQLSRPSRGISPPLDRCRGSRDHSGDPDARADRIRSLAAQSGLIPLAPQKAVSRGRTRQPIQC